MNIKIKKLGKKIDTLLLENSKLKLNTRLLEKDNVMFYKQIIKYSDKKKNIENWLRDWIFDINHIIEYWYS
jgi:hypothetical protein